VGRTDGVCDCGNIDPKHKSGKHPNKSAPRAHFEATNDPAKVAKLWSDYPNANIGIALKPSGLCIIAPDSPEWLARFQERGLQESVTVQSGGGEGHQHYWYLLPEDWPIYRLCRTGEFDIITDGYGVMPPSMHKSGREYSYIVSPQDLGITHVSQLPEAPGWALEMLLEATERPEDEPDDPQRATGQHGPTRA
jgi:hypothetical protein